MKIIFRTLIIGCSMLIAGSAADVFFNSSILTKETEARIGRPLTPLSYAGVARRTSRRVIRRSVIYVPALPPSCTTVIIEGTMLQQCGGSYYKPYNNQYVVVYVD